MAEDAITAAITSSMESAGLMGGDSDSGGSDGFDGGDSGDSGDTGAAAAEGAADGAADGDAESAAAVGEEASPSAGAGTPEPKAAAETPEQKTRRENLEALGLKAPKPGERENRLPHKRVVQMVEKAQASARDAAVKELQPRLAAAEESAATLARLNVMADRDPMRYVEALAVTNPAKWKPILQQLQGGAAPEGKKAPAAAAPDSLAGKPRPAPNVKLADGSSTYDEKGLDDLLKWTSDNAVAQATELVTKQFEERFGPIEREHKDASQKAAWDAANRPRIQAQIKTARELWGDLFEQDYQKAEKGEPSEILTYQREHRCSFEQACQAVLLPRVRADRNTMRADLLKELNGRPAATTQPRSAVKGTASPSGDPVTDAIRNSMAAAGLS